MNLQKHQKGLNVFELLILCVELLLSIGAFVFVTNLTGSFLLSLLAAIIAGFFCFMPSLYYLVKDLIKEKKKGK